MEWYFKSCMGLSFFSHPPLSKAQQRKTLYQIKVFFYDIFKNIIFSLLTKKIYVVE